MKMCNLSLYQNVKKWWNPQNEKGENTNMCHFLPLRIGGPFFGLKTGSRGTPWNSKSAQPGGSDFTNCRFWPFKWHFGVFGGVCIFDTFLSLFHFSILSLFLFFWFCILSLFSLFGFCRFWSLFWFCHFYPFSHFFIILIYFSILKRVS